MEYNCNICKKDYSSYKSLWLHNYKYHKKPVVESCRQVVHNVVECKKSVVENVVDGCSQDSYKKHKNSICKYCNENFCDRTYRWRHEKICKKKDTIIENSNKKKVEDEKELFERFKKQMLEDEDIRTEILKVLKIHPKQLQKINNQLNLNQQNNINNTSVYCQLGYENFQEKLSNKKKLGILNRQANSVNQFVEMIYQNDDFKPYQNVYITNLRSNTAYKYDEQQNKFITVKQKDVLDHLFETRLNDIQQFYDELQDNMDPYKAKQMKLFLERIENELVYRNIKKEEVKLVLYNNKESVKKIYDEMNKEIEI